MNCCEPFDAYLAEPQPVFWANGDGTWDIGDEGGPALVERITHCPFCGAKLRRRGHNAGTSNPL